MATDLLEVLEKVGIDKAPSTLVERAVYSDDVTLSLNI